MTKEEIIKETIKPLAPTYNLTIADCQQIVFPAMDKYAIQYAISVLKEVLDGYQFMSEDGITGIPMGSITDKIKELKSILCLKEK
jgi:hypothetical protein